MAIDGWTRKSLGSFTQFIKGITYASEDYCKEDEGAIFLTIKCVSKSGGFKLEGIKYYRGIIHEHEKLKEGDILISNTDLTRDGDIVGCPIMVPFLGANEVTMSMDLSKLVIDSFQVDSKFLYYKLMTDKVRRFMQDHASGSTVLHLQTKAVPTLELLIPDKKEEQEKIAEVLSTIDLAIAQTEAIIAKQQRIKTGLMQDLLTKGIDENGNIRSEATHEFKDSAIGRIPVEWDSLKAKDVCLLITKGTTPKRRDTESDNYPIPFLRVQNITFDGVIDFSSDKEFISKEVHHKELFRSIIYPKDVLQNIVGPPLGKICIVSSEYPEWNANQAIAIFRPNQKITSDFLYYWLLSTKAKVWFEVNSKRTSGQQNLTLEQCQELPIALPSLDEQKQIHSVIGQISDLQSIQLKYLQKLNSQKRGLMQDLLTGKVRVTNLLNQKAAANKHFKIYQN